MDKFFFELSNNEFTKLCFELLNKEYNFDKIILSDGLIDKNIDIYGEKDQKKYAILVKHRYIVESNKLKTEFEKYSKITQAYDYFIYITSAEVDLNFLLLQKYSNVILIEQTKLLQLLIKHKDTFDKYSNINTNNRKKNEKTFTISLFGVITSLVFTILTLTVPLLITKHSNDLDNRIENVESTLKNLEGMESYLKTIKNDMVKMNEENKAISEEYLRIQKIKGLITDDKKTLKNIISFEPWYIKIITFITGIITGIATSMFGNIIYEKFKKEKELKKKI